MSTARKMSISELRQDIEGAVQRSRTQGMGQGMGRVPEDFSETPEDFKDYLCVLLCPAPGPVLAQ